MLVTHKETNFGQAPEVETINQLQEMPSVLVSNIEYPTAQALKLGLERIKDLELQAALDRQQILWEHGRL